MASHLHSNSIESVSFGRPECNGAQDSGSRGAADHPAVSAIWIVRTDVADSAEIQQAYVDSLKRLPCTTELIVVLNGESSRTPILKKQLAATTLTARIVQLHRASDESTAMKVGLDVSRGEILILLPPYIQSDPVALESMIERICAGSDYVASWRRVRVDSAWSALKSRIFNYLTRLATGIELHDINSGLRVMRAEVPQNLPIYGDLHRFMPVLAAMHGFRVAEVPTRHLEERVRQGDHALGVYFRRALDVLTLFFLFKFTKKPLRFFGLIGCATAAIGSVIVSTLVVERFFGTTALTDRPALLFGMLFIVLGVNLVSLGLLGELIIYIHGNRLRDYHVECVYENMD